MHYLHSVSNSEFSWGGLRLEKSLSEGSPWAERELIWKLWWVWWVVKVPHETFIMAPFRVVDFGWERERESVCVCVCVCVCVYTRAHEDSSGVMNQCLKLCVVIWGVNKRPHFHPDTWCCVDFTAGEGRWVWNLGFNGGTVPSWGVSEAGG